MVSGAFSSLAQGKTPASVSDAGSSRALYGCLIPPQAVRPAGGVANHGDVFYPTCTFIISDPARDLQTVWDAF